jgi:hypothetical protein
MKKALVALLLLPPLIAGPPDQLPDSVRTLLRKPRLAAARMTFRDGTHAAGRITRVTDQFVSFSSQSPVSGRYENCSNIKLDRITALKWLPSESGTDFFDYLIFFPVWYLIFGIPGIVEMLSHRGLPSGAWESVSVDANGRINRLEFDDRAVRSQDVLVKQGHYHLEDDRLHFMYESEPDQVAAVHFECDMMVVDWPDGPVKLGSPQMHHAYPPVVGRWGTRWQEWDLRPDGSLRMEKVEDGPKGTMQRVKGGIKVSWSPDPWHIRREHGRLFITKNGSTIEYKQSSPVH